MKQTKLEKEHSLENRQKLPITLQRRFNTFTKPPPPRDNQISKPQAEYQIIIEGIEAVGRLRQLGCRATGSCKHTARGWAGVRASLGVTRHQPRRGLAATGAQRWGTGYR